MTLRRDIERASRTCFNRCAPAPAAQARKAEAATKAAGEAWAALPVEERRQRLAARLDELRDRHKALNLPFHHMGMVTSIMGHIDAEFAKRLAAHSVPAVMSALPIAPLPNE